MARTFGNNTYVIAYNGKLYNTSEPQRELEIRGYKSQTHSDTEVLLTPFIKW